MSCAECVDMHTVNEATPPSHTRKCKPGWLGTLRYDDSPAVRKRGIVSGTKGRGSVKIKVKRTPGTSEVAIRWSDEKPSVWVAGEGWDLQEAGGPLKVETKAKPNSLPSNSSGLFTSVCINATDKVETLNFAPALAGSW